MKGVAGLADEPQFLQGILGQRPRPWGKPPTFLREERTLQGHLQSG